ncbi:MAG: hypothetical protein ACTSQ2_12645 [Candidatus Heimdallarchaeaceae archaeon]
MKKDSYVFGYQSAMEEVAKRTCEKCKFYSHKEGNQPDGMLWEIEDCEIYSSVVPQLIDREGCNKWERIKD